MLYLLVCKSDYGTKSNSDLFRYNVCFLFFKQKRRIFYAKKFISETIFALMTVIVTVHAYVFYSLYVINGSILMESTGATDVINAINTQGGVYMFGQFVPIWTVVIIEFCFAFLLELVMGSPCSFKLVIKIFDPQKTKPVLFETAIISATVSLMCPAMSFVAAWLYYPYYDGFNIITLLANWIKLVCYNFPFAFLRNRHLKSIEY